MPWGCRVSLSIRSGPLFQGREQDCGFEVSERKLDDALDGLLWNHLPPTETQARKLTALGEFVDEVIRDAEGVRCLGDGEDQAL